MLPGDPLILIISEENAHFYFLNTITGEIWEIKIPLERMGSYDFVAWSRDGCELIMGPHHAIGGNVIRMDLRGNVLQELISFEGLLADVGQAALTSSEDKLAYTGVGRFVTPIDNGYSFLGTFLDVVDLSHGTGAYRLSEINANIPSMLAWSPNGEWLAYAEYDPNQVLQVVISRPDGSERRQLTQFIDSIASLHSLRWSPTGTGLGFLYNPDVNAGPESYLVVVPDINSEIPSHFVEVDGSRLIYDFWWQSDTTVIAYRGSVLWIDVTNDKVVDTLNASEIPEGYISWMRPIEGSNLIGFFSNSGENFYLYDQGHHIFTRLPNVANYSLADYEVYDNWVITPSTFPGEANCAP